MYCILYSNFNSSGVSLEVHWYRWVSLYPLRSTRTVPPINTSPPNNLMELHCTITRRGYAMLSSARRNTRATEGSSARAHQTSRSSSRPQSTMSTRSALLRSQVAFDSSSSAPTRIRLAVWSTSTRAAAPNASEPNFTNLSARRRALRRVRYWLWSLFPQKGSDTFIPLYSIDSSIQHPVIICEPMKRE